MNSSFDDIGIVPKKKSFYAKGWFWLVLLLTAAVLFFTNLDNIFYSESHAADTVKSTLYPTAPTASPEFAEIVEDTSKNQSGVFIEPTELVNENGVYVAAMSYDDDAWLGKALMLYVKNDSDKDIVLSVTEFSINGYMVSTYLYETVAAGDDMYTSLDIFGYSLTVSDISYVMDIACRFKIADVHDLSNCFYPKAVTIETSINGNYTQPIDKRGLILYEDDLIKVVYRYSYDDTSLIYYTFYIENNSNQSLDLQLSGVRANKKSINPLFECRISSGKRKSRP